MILKGRTPGHRRRVAPPKKRRAVVTKDDAEIEGERRACLLSLSYFARRAWHVLEPTKTYHHNWHIDVICAHLMALFFRTPAKTGPNKGEPVRELLINIPPRHMKSILCSVVFPAWCWAHDPGRQFFYSSYAQSLSDDHSAATMKLVKSAWYQRLFGQTGNPFFDADGYVSLAGKQQTRHFETSMGGARQASSVMGKTTGAGGDILGADDPHNVLEKESDAKMARVITWWSRAMSTRGNDPKTVGTLVVMQRVAEADLSDWCIKQGYSHLKIPARYEGEKEIGVLGHQDPRTEIGQPMWPARHDDVELQKLEAKLKDDAAGQLQQRPAPAGGQAFRVGKLRRMSRHVMDRLLEAGQLDELITVWDLAVKGRTNRRQRRSYCVGATWGRLENSVFLFDVFRDQIGFTEQCDAVEAAARRWPTAQVYIEDRANGPAVADALLSKVPGIQLVPPRGDKDKRAYAVAPFFRTGDVWVPEDGITDWLEDWLREHEYFPNAAHDDQVDTTSMALDLLLVHGWTEPMLPDGRTIREDAGAGDEMHLRAVADRRARVDAIFDARRPGAETRYTGAYD